MKVAKESPSETDDYTWWNRAPIENPKVPEPTPEEPHDDCEREHIHLDATLEE
jgi:hypothetical protein